MPQAFIDRADEVVVVDAPPEADAAIGADQLSQLRQRALLLTADVVDRQLEDVPSAARHPVVVGHAGAHPRLHDAARERGQNAGERPAERGSVSR